MAGDLRRDRKCYRWLDAKGREDSGQGACCELHWSRELDIEAMFKSPEIEGNFGRVPA